MIANFWRRARMALSFPFLFVISAGAMFWGGSTPPPDTNRCVSEASIFVFEFEGRIELPPPMPEQPRIV
jgi:hypothetical protein